MSTVLQSRIPSFTEIIDLDGFDTAFLQMMGYVKFVPVEKLMVDVIKASKDVVLFGPQARLLRHILLSTFKRESKALLDELRSSWDLSGDISLRKNPLDAFKKYPDVGKRTWEASKKKVMASLELIQKKALAEANKMLKVTLKSDDQANAFIAAAMSDHIQAFTEKFPERTLHQEIQRLVRIIEQDPDMRLIDKGALKERLLRFDQIPDRYFTNMTDVQAGRMWTYTEMQRFHETGVIRYQVTAQWDRRTCNVCQNLDGKVFEVARARDRMLRNLSSGCSSEKAQKAGKPDYCQWFASERDKIRDKIGTTRLPKPSIDPRGNYVRGRDGKWTLDGKAVDDKMVKRLNDMKLPPAWFPAIANSAKDPKILATGFDKAGRWQPRYSEKWQEGKAKIKFDRSKLLGRSLPGMREKVEAGMKAGDPRAYLFNIEDRTAIRAGSKKDFKAKKKAYGLTTLQHEHVKMTGKDSFELNFTAKEGIKAKYEITDKQLADFIRERKNATKTGDMLFKDVSAEKLNKYIKETAGRKEFTIKDFRTYHGTRLARQELKQYEGKNLTPKQKKEAIKQVTEKVSAFLRNTPAMAKKSYIDPVVFEMIGGL